MRPRTFLAGVVAIAATALFAVALVPAGAGVTNTHIVVRKSVEGPATGPFTVVVACSTDDGDGGIMNEATLGFDATGAPTSVEPAGPPWSIVDGAWQLDTIPPIGPTECTATETDADGATSTSWTCDFQDQRGSLEPPGGCAAPGGTGIGPVGFTLNSVGDEAGSQTATVHFTNTVAAEPLDIAPAFTG